MKRELQEELNLPENKYKLKFIKKIPPFNLPSSSFCGFFLIKTDSTPNFNPDDIDKVEWLSINEIENNISKCHPTKPDFPIFLEILKKK